MDMSFADLYGGDAVGVIDLSAKTEDQLVKILPALNEEGGMIRCNGEEVIYVPDVSASLSGSERTN